MRHGAGTAAGVAAGIIAAAAVLPCHTSGAAPPPLGA